jgi:hypothetical protein
MFDYKHKTKELNMQIGIMITASPSNAAPSPEVESDDFFGARIGRFAGAGFGAGGAILADLIFRSCAS